MSGVNSADGAPRSVDTATQRGALAMLAAEQAALLRVAQLVASHGPRERVFALVTDELGKLLGLEMVRTIRYEPDGSGTTLAARGGPGDPRAPGTNFPLPEGGVLERVLRTGCPVRSVNYAEIGGATGVSLRRAGVVCAAAGPIVVDGRIWGAMVAAAVTVEGLPPGSERRIAQFAELVSTAISNIESRAKVEQLAAEQSALRRVATAVARQRPAEEVFTLVTSELSGLLGVDLMVRMVRFESDGTATILATQGTPGDVLPLGTNTPRPPGGILDQVFRTGRPGRVDDYADVTGPVSAALRRAGIGSAVAGPIVVDGRTWGAMAIASQRPLPLGSEHRVAQFAELVSTAISNIESRAQVERLAAEQSALRRVATLVAREHSPEQLVRTLVEEIGVLLRVDGSAILRYEAGGNATVLACWADGEITVKPGARFAPEDGNLVGKVFRSGEPARHDGYDGDSGASAVVMRELGVRSAVASPIVVEGSVWGLIIVMSRSPVRFRPDTEARMHEFCRHAGMAVANAKSRSDLAESRARIVRAADEARRRVERDLHDGAQQQLVSIALHVRAAGAKLPPGSELGATLSRLGAAVDEVLDGLRELSHGIHPAVLSDGGLGAALNSLARRASLPVALHLDLHDERFDEPVEVAAYYVTSEALANTAKHAHASHIDIIARQIGRWLELTVSDDGVGGAQPDKGTGLIGLTDRVEALGGTILIDTRATVGTTIHVRLPLEQIARFALARGGERP